MPDPTFEAILAGQLRDYAEGGVRPIDRYAVAQATIASGSVRGFGIRPGFAPPGRLRFASFGTVILLAILAAALLLVIGRQDPSKLPSLTYIQDGDVYLALAEGGSPVKLLDDPAVDFTRVTWIQDGRRLAVEGANLLTVVDPASGEPRRAGVSQGGVSWSPDGHSYATVRTSDTSWKLVVGNVDSGAEREVHLSPSAAGLNGLDGVTWSPDGRWIAGTVSGLAQLARIDVATGSVELLLGPQPDGTIIGDVSWSPDSSRLAYVSASYADGLTPGRTIHVVDATGGTPLQVVAPVTESEAFSNGPYEGLGPRLLPTWSPDGAWIAFRGAPGLAVARPDGRDRRDLVTSPVAGFAWATDGSAITFVATTSLVDAHGLLSSIGLNEDRLRSLALQGVTGFDVLRPRPGRDVLSAWPSTRIAEAQPTPSARMAAPAETPKVAGEVDPAGSWRGLAYESGADGCHPTYRFAAFDRPGGNPEDLLPGFAFDCSIRANLSPDGTRAAIGDGAFGDGGDLVIVDLRDGTRTTIPTAGSKVGGYRWSPRGRSLNIVTWEPDTAYVVAADGLVRHDLPTPQGAGWGAGDWSPDESRFSVGTDDGLLVGNGDGSDLRMVGDFPYQVTWSPDGRRFAFHRDGDIWVANADGSDAHDLTHFEFGGASTVAWAQADGPIAVRQGRIVWLVDLDGTKRQVEAPVSGSPDDVTLRWSPDGARLGLATGGAIYLIPLDGMPMVRIDGATDPSWSPDGRFLAMLAGADGTRGIDVANADGSGRRQVVTSPIPPRDTGFSRDIVWVPMGGDR